MSRPALVDLLLGHSLWAARIRRFAIVGSLGSALYAAVVWLMIDWLLIAPLTAASLAFLAVVVVNYQLHYRWTFASNKAHIIAFSQFLTTSLFGFAVNLGILYFGFSIKGFNYVSVQIAAILIVIMSNFLLSALWVFRDGRMKRT